MLLLCRIKDPVLSAFIEEAKLRFTGLGTELVLTDLNVAQRGGKALVKT